MSAQDLPPPAPRPPLPDNEAERLAALRATRLLDTPREQAFDDLVALATAVTGASMAAVSLIDAERQWFKAAFGFDACETPRDIAFCAHTILDPRHMLVVEDATRDPRFARNPVVTGEMGIRFYAGVPLVDAEGNALGSLCVFDQHPRKLGEREAAALRALARQAAFLIELRRTTEALNLQMRERAWYQQQLLHYSQLLEAQNADLALQTRTDQLTGLPNRRGYGELMGAALGHAEEEGTPLSVAIVDLDHFKNINDSLGHPEGDRVLVRVAQVLAEQMKDVGLAARYGGEEFAPLLPATGLEQAREHCHAVCDAVAAMDDCSGVTVSIGVAQWQPGELPGQALSRADAALYRAKLGGRNRVELAS
ncbi:diguanylate cyclase [Pseudoxanthomonas suwonensis 11-1]|uniref:Diguanylate cyclase n=1 Tax=Pseudoxanthomonas suwonensis (strain 11-1) TaxID=743721 RepID=E6WUP4_PSEUU|nr:sensor domain-containing diguanylate cyclase [Pseudoxanthomonas suwonensis]ADV27746.1 diguanylate cyclase [Pseudoxanthomonas suwonensis 11-1]